MFISTGVCSSSSPPPRQSRPLRPSNQFSLPHNFLHPIHFPARSHPLRWPLLPDQCSHPHSNFGVVCRRYYFHFCSHSSLTSSRNPLATVRNFSRLFTFLFLTVDFPYPASALFRHDLRFQKLLNFTKLSEKYNTYSKTFTHFY